MTLGIHHITAIASDPQNTIDFYSEILGLRLVKKTVNQDDTSAYHLFFGDNVGTPGMDLTFFTFSPVREGIHGAGMVNKIMLAVEHSSLEFWKKRLSEFSIKFNEKENELRDKFLEFRDWDGQILQIVETDRINKDYKEIKEQVVENKFAIKNFYGVEMNTIEVEESAKVIEELLQFKKIEENIYENSKNDFANLIFLKKSEQVFGQSGAGTVHHIAFQIEDEEKELELRKNIKEFGLHPTEVIDRFYFKSVYFREPGGVLFEIATNGPGFTADQKEEHLGKSLALPPFLEDEREQIEKGLVEVYEPKEVEHKSKLLSLFKHYEVFSRNKNTIFLLHGTGGDEYDLFKLLDYDTLQNNNVVSLRGNIKEHGMNRFFKREGLGKYDKDSIETEAKKLKEFIENYSFYRNIKKDNITFIGFSNGANMILAASLIYPELFSKTVLLHPANVYSPPASDKLDLSKLNSFVSYGEYDQMIQKSESEEVIELLKSFRAKVTYFNNMSGHNITVDEVDRVNEFVR